jgi:hypothetical protein
MIPQLALSPYAPRPCPIASLNSLGLARNQKTQCSDRPLSPASSPLLLSRLWYKESAGIPFSWMILAFGLFIVTCGITHLMEARTYGTRYWLADELKVLTAIAATGLELSRICCLERASLIRASRGSPRASTCSRRSIYERQQARQPARTDSTPVLDFVLPITIRAVHSADPWHLQLSRGWTSILRPM